MAVQLYDGLRMHLEPDPGRRSNRFQVADVIFFRVVGWFKDVMVFHVKLYSVTGTVVVVKKGGAIAEIIVPRV